jgi:CubicO group peptidase (beta-lactamase class C family)
VGVYLTEVEDLIPIWMEKHAVPGVSIRLFEDGEIIWSEDIGVRSSNCEGQVTPDTIFEAASISKPIFAYAVLGLHEKGIIDLDDPLDDYLPQPYLNDDPRLSLITMRWVLCHSTGFQNWRGKESLKIHFKPGERFFYSGEGYVYLQRVVEEVTGLPLEGFMETALLRPFGMTDSSYVWLDEYDGRMAYPHDEGEKAGELRRRSEAKSASSLYSTSRDIARFMIEIVEPSDRGCPHLTPETVDEMLAPQMRVNDYISWGLGWGLQHTDDGDSFWHWGDNGGYKNFATASRERGMGVVVMTNGANGLKLCEELIPMVMRDPQPAFGEFLNVMIDKGYII